MRKHSAAGRVKAAPELPAKARVVAAIPPAGQAPAGGDEFTFGPFVLRSDHRELMCDGVLRPMERRAFDLLHYLLKHHGRVVTKDELLEQVWQRRCVTDSVIAQAVLKVRKSLSDVPGFDCPVQTVHRVGYRVVGEVRHRRVAPGLNGRGPALLAVLWLAPRLAHGLDLPPWLPGALAGFSVLSLQAHGVQPIDTERATNLHDDTVQASGLLRLADTESDGGDGPPVFVLEVDLAAPDWRTRVTASAGSPFEAAWRAAGSTALALRLRQILLSTSPGEVERRWERLAALVGHPPPQMASCSQHLPALWCRSLVERSLDAEADILMEGAWRGDPRTPQESNELRRRASRVDASRLEGWSDLCLAVYEWTAGDPRRVAHLVDRALTHFDHATTTSLAVRAGAIAEHLMAAVGADWAAPVWWRHLRDAPIVDGSAGIRRWHRLANLHRQIARDAPSGLAFHRTSDAGSNVAPGCEGLQALLHALSGQMRHADGDLDTALNEWTRAHDLAERSPWLTPRLLSRLALGDLAARLDDRIRLDACLQGLDHLAIAGLPRWRAVNDWLQARRLRLNAQPQMAWGLVEKALPVLSHCSLWFRDEAWLFAIDTAWQTRSRPALSALRDTISGHTRQHNRSIAAIALAADATLALLDRDMPQATQFMLRAWQTAPSSSVKRQLAMAAATAMLWRRPPSAQALDQALSQAGAWLQRSSNGQRLSQLHRRPYGVLSASSPEPYRVAEPEADLGWLWAP